ncbi:MAG: hypothetical protein AAF846_25620 [Chloroflexota bacterium]
MRLNYFVDGKTHTVEKASKQQIFEVIAKIASDTIHHVHIFFDIGSLSIIGGHSERLAIIANNIQTNGNIITGLLTDPNVSDYDIKMDFLDEDGYPNNNFQLYQTVPKEKGFKVIRHFLVEEEMPSEALWTKRYR